MVESDIRGASSCSFPGISSAATTACSMPAMAGTTWPCPSPCTGRRCNEDRDVLQRDPDTFPLVNQGRRGSSTAKTQRHSKSCGRTLDLRARGQYADGVQRIIRSYLDSLGKTNQKAAWVSGFFGSGKVAPAQDAVSPVAGHCLSRWATARAIVPAMPDELRELLRELDTAGRRAGGLLAAAGSLPSGTTDQVRLTILGILLRAVGLPEQYPRHASACGSIRKATSTR